MTAAATVLPIILWLVSSAALLSVFAMVTNRNNRYGCGWPTCSPSRRSTVIEVAHARRRSLTVIRYRREVGPPSYTMPVTIPGQVVDPPRRAIEAASYSPEIQNLLGLTAAQREHAERVTAS
jgi:hypothetical protein